MHRHRRAVDMQLAHQAALTACQLRPVRRLPAAFPEAQQRDQDILAGVLVREESLPPAVGDVVPAHALDLRGADPVLDLVDAHLARAHVAARGAEVFHPAQRQFAQVAVFHARGDERHGDVALHAVDAGPGRDQGHDARDEVDECVRGVVLVAARAPELVQPRAADHERGVDFQAVGAEGRVGEVFLELVEVAFHADVGQVRHHVADDFEAGVFGQAEGVGDGGDGVAAVGVPRDVFVEGLHADFEPGAAVGQHAGQMGLEAIVWSGLDRYADTLDRGVRGCGYGFVHRGP